MTKGISRKGWTMGTWRIPKVPAWVGTPVARRAAALVGVTCFAALTLIALRQAPYPDAYHRLTIWEQFWYPIERDAPERLIFVTAHLRGVCTLRGTKHVWVCGAGGLVLHSADAGRSWTQLALVQVPRGTATDPRDTMARPSPGSGVADAGDNTVALDAVLLADRSATAPSPRPADTDAAADLRTQQSQPARSATSPAGPSGTKEPAVPLNLMCVSFCDEQNGWVAGFGVVMATTDAGRTWTQVVIPPELTLQGMRGLINQVVFFDPSHGLAGVGGSDAWAHYVRGASPEWTEVRVPQIPDADTRLHAVTWDRETPGLAWLLIDPASGDAGDTLYKISDFGGAGAPAAAGRIPSKAFDLAQAFCVTDGGTIVYVANEDGTVTRCVPASGDVRRVPTGVRNSLFGITFGDGGLGWVVGDDGTILATRDGGDAWFRQSQEFTPVNGQAPTKQDSGEVISDRIGPDTTFSPFTTYRIYPAPWYWLSCVALAAAELSLILFKPTPDAPVPTGSSISEIFVSDRALRPGDYDALGLGTLATGLSGFLRNDRTPPPLTLAITGDWGSGKSSLMNLLDGDLRSHGFWPVAFNAWHHQKEEQVLAALLEAIRGQAIPPWYTRAGILFRLRLLRLRASRNWLPLTALLLVLCACVGYLVQDQNPRRAAEDLSGLMSRAAGWVAHLRGTSEQTDENKTDKEGAATTAPSTRPSGDGSTSFANALPRFGTYGAFAASLLVLAGGAYRALRAFGIEPAELLAASRTQATRADLAASSSFRARFAQEFNEVAEALDPRSMLILIDDLDRCRPESVLEILEAVNFLVSNGKVFVVLGMAPGRVIPAIALAFKGVAEEMNWTPQSVSATPAPGAGNATEAIEGVAQQGRAAGIAGPKGIEATAEHGASPDPDPAPEVRREFARNYLEKLINIEVPVPKLESARCFGLLVGHAASDSSDPGAVLAAANLAGRAVQGDGGEVRLSRGARAAVVAVGRGALTAGGFTVRAASAAARWGATWILLAALLSFMLGKAWHQRVERLARADASNAGGPATAPHKAPQPTSLPVTRPGPDATTSAPASAIAPDVDPHSALGWAALGGIPLAVLCAWILGLRDDPVTRDSPAFEAALRIWSPAIAAAHPTPRRVKRFLNRVRYVAMVRRAVREAAGEPSGGQRSGASTEQTAANPGDATTDADLVAVATLHALCPDLTCDPDRLSKLGSEQTKAALATIALPGGLKPDALEDILKKHREKWSKGIDGKLGVEWSQRSGQVVVR